MTGLMSFSTDELRNALYQEMPIIAHAARRWIDLLQIGEAANGISDSDLRKAALAFGGILVPVMVAGMLHPRGVTRAEVVKVLRTTDHGLDKLEKEILRCAEVLIESVETSCPAIIRLARTSTGVRRMRRHDRVSETQKMPRDVEFFSTDSDPDRLYYRDRESAVAEYLDNLPVGEHWPDKVTIYGFAPVELPSVEVLTEWILGDLVERLDQEYGDPDSDPDELDTPEVKAAARYLAELARRHFIPGIFQQVSSEQVSAEDVDTGPFRDIPLKGHRDEQAPS